MTDRLWVRRREGLSWHIVRGTSYQATGVTSSVGLCGLRIRIDQPAEWADTLPAGKSCEMCLRLHARVTDTPATNDAVPEEGT